MTMRTVCIIPASNVTLELELFRKNHIYHPGSIIPLHTTIIGNSFDVNELTDEVDAKLRTLAIGFEPFEYIAKSICAFPTSRTLWLSPSPQRRFEEITETLYSEFPQFRYDNAYPIYHMTVAYNSKESASENLANCFLEEFKQKLPFNLIANELAIYGEINNTWEHVLSLPFGKR